MLAFQSGIQTQFSFCQCVERLQNSEQQFLHRKQEAALSQGCTLKSCPWKLKHGGFSVLSSLNFCYQQSMLSGIVPVLSPPERDGRFRDYQTEQKKTPTNNNHPKTDKTKPTREVLIRILYFRIISVLWQEQLCSGSGWLTVINVERLLSSSPSHSPLDKQHTVTVQERHKAVDVFLNLEFILKLELINYTQTPQIITARSSENNVN